MRKILLSIIVLGFISSCWADVHKFRGSDGSALLTNRKPQIRKDVLPSVATEKDLVLNVSSPQSEGVEYTYQGSKKIIPTVETVRISARDVYKQGWCKINNSIVPCYNYEKTLPATSFKVKGSKAIEANPNAVLREAVEDVEQNKQ